MFRYLNATALSYTGPHTGGLQLDSSSNAIGVPLKPQNIFWAYL